MTNSADHDLLEQLNLGNHYLLQIRIGFSFCTHVDNEILRMFSPYRYVSNVYRF